MGDMPAPGLLYTMVGDHDGRRYHIPRGSIMIALLLGILLVTLVPDPASSQDDRERLYGPHTYDETAVIARELSAEQPASAWERAVEGEAADLIEFLSEDVALVGMVDVNGRGQPRHGRLYQLNAVTGEITWEFERDNVSGGSYSLLQMAPHLLLLGANDQSARFTSLDPATGRKVWDEAFDGPFDVTLTEDALLVQYTRGDEYRVRALELTTGRTRWETRLSAAQARPTAPPMVRVMEDVVVVMSGAVTELDLHDGTVGRVMSSPFTGDGWHAAFLGRHVLVHDRTNLALFDRDSGTTTWHTSVAGAIRNVVPFDAIIVVSDDAEHRATITHIGREDGRAGWVYHVGHAVVSPVVTAAGLLMFTTDSTLVGLRKDNGTEAFVTRLPDDMPDGGPSFAPVMGMPDVLRTSADRVFVARERAGVAAFSLPLGTVDWYQQHYDPSIAILNYTGEGRYAYVLDALFTTGRIGGLEDVTLPPSLSARTGGGDYLLQSAQQNYESARQRYEAGRGTASDVQMAAELNIAAQQMSITWQRLNSGIALANAIVNVASAIRQVMEQKAQQGLIDRAQLAMQGALRGQTALYQEAYYVRPFYLEGRGRGVTLVDTATGLRNDLIFAPHNPPSIAFGVDMPTFAVSPSGRRLMAVGISLKPDTWLARNKWDSKVPNYSVLSYNLGAFEFEERIALNRPAAGANIILAIVEQNAERLTELLEAGGNVNTQDSATGMTPLHMATAFANVDLVQILLEHGADVNRPNAQGKTPLDFGHALPQIREILEAAGAEFGTGPEPAAPPPPADPNAPPPLAHAALSGNLDAVRELLAAGADPNWTSVDGETPLHYAVAIRRADIVRVLLEAGADPDIRSNAGKRPIDFAATDEIRELLRRN